MRQGQQNRRGRGRNNNNNSNINNGRKPQNPLSRIYESNGPEQKIKGTAAQIAEKYLAWARDKQASGDTVLAENYFQHAEHYNRIIMAAQVQAAPQHAHGEHGHGPNGQHRSQPQPDGSYGMRDQPQPIIEQPIAATQPVILPGMEPQPDIEPQLPMNGTPADDDAEAAQPSARGDNEGRRRRRRYPAGGSPRGTTAAAEPAAPNGHNGAGNGNGLDSGDARPSDEALAN